MQRFVDDVDQLVSETVTMCESACRMFDRAISSFVDGDTEIAEEVMKEFQTVDSLDVGIEESAIRILTIYQPTAIDARTVATILKSITYLERIGKYSYNIAKATMYLQDKPMYPPVDLIQPLGDVASRMVKLVVKAFEEKDSACLEKLSEMDDFLDKSMRKDLDQITAFMKENPASVDVCTYYISVIKFIERVGDHCCKMAEKVYFMISGKHTRIE